MKSKSLIGQTLLSIYSEDTNGDQWPNIYLVTENGCYLYDPENFVPTTVPANGSEVKQIEHAKGKQITEALTDGELTVLKLEDESVVFFEIGHSSIDGGICSWPTVGYESKTQSESWIPQFCVDAQSCVVLP